VNWIRAPVSPKGNHQHNLAAVLVPTLRAQWLLPGVQFALWAPNARSVRCSVIFNKAWMARHHSDATNGWAAFLGLFHSGLAVAPSTNTKCAAPRGTATRKATPYGFSA